MDKSKNLIQAAYITYLIIASGALAALSYFGTKATLSYVMGHTLGIKTAFMTFLGIFLGGITVLSALVSIFLLIATIYYTCKPRKDTNDGEKT